MTSTVVPPTWHGMLDAILKRNANLPSSTFVQVASVRADGRPANRTLTFRFFLSANRLLFTADSRTEKITQFETNPWAEACWYFSESRVQFRLLGKMQAICDTDDGELILARLRTWQERSTESRQSFTWPFAGQPLADLASFEHTAPAKPPSNFSLLVLTPEQVEILDLSQQPHARTLYRREEANWQAEEINP